MMQDPGIGETLKVALPSHPGKRVFCPSTLVCAAFPVFHGDYIQLYTVIAPLPQDTWNASSLTLCDHFCRTAQDFSLFKFIVLVGQQFHFCKVRYSPSPGLLERLNFLVTTPFRRNLWPTMRGGPRSIHLTDLQSIDRSLSQWRLRKLASIVASEVTPSTRQKYWGTAIIFVLMTLACFCPAKSVFVNTTISRYPLLCSRLQASCQKHMVI